MSSLAVRRAAFERILRAALAEESEMVPMTDDGAVVFNHAMMDALQAWVRYRVVVDGEGRYWTGAVVVPVSPGEDVVHWLAVAREAIAGCIAGLKRRAAGKLGVGDVVEVEYRDYRVVKTDESHPGGAQITLQRVRP